MRGFQEIKGQSVRLVYDRDNANFRLETGPHLFLVGKPATEVKPEYKNGNGATTARTSKC